MNRPPHTPPLHLKLEGADDPGDQVHQSSALAVIRGIKNQSISPRNLSPADRQSCVEHLIGEGLAVFEIAEILKVSEKTISRDRKAIQAAHALEPHPELIPQMVGRLVSEADLVIMRIRRAARDKESTPAIKVDAEHRCYQITSDVIHRLQHLGYLPMATHRLEANLNHQIDDLPNFGELKLEIQRLRVVAGKDEEAVAKLGEIEQTVLHAHAAHSVKQLGHDLAKGAPCHATTN